MHSFTMIFFATGHGASVQQGLDVIARQGRFVVFSVFNGDVLADWSLIGKQKSLNWNFFRLFFSYIILHMQIGNDTIFYPESNQLKHPNFFLKIIITWIILQYSIQSHTYRKETIFFLGESTILPLGCPRMFKLVNQCWPQVFLVKYIHRMWGNQKYLDFLISSLA